MKVSEITPEIVAHLPPECKAEVEGLDKLPELAATPFPYRDKRDFRGFTEDDYANFVAGTFVKVTDPSQVKWMGGAARFDAAKEKLESLGYAPIESECTMHGQRTLTFTAQGTFGCLK